ncbi:hypothetical protein D9619_009569 [Psilocybe cf. subviscida]|uniref:Peptidase A1 domain-containing protein n=1 Tax=Psilocybe cf. subviscida TaxID=2480587 RepID=A0A8H5BLG0_9AGAR|nr:hypothetical protein D9619_009569 [Psilocybe cf. subviscida]
MKFSALCLALLATTAHGLRVPLQRRAPRGASMRSPRSGRRYSFGGSTDKEAIGNSNDLRYTTNVTVNGVEVTVVLDTGSTDLWVIPPGGLGSFNDTGIAIELLYGDGSYGAKGTIGVSPFLWGTYSIEKQAFMNAVESTIGNLQESAIYGVLGLSFDHALASPINAHVQQVYGEDATWGRSVLRNIFEQHPTEPNFIAMDLTRTGDLEDTAGGSFTIGEYEQEDYAQAVEGAPVLPQFPVGGNRWTVLLDGIYVDQVPIELKSAVSDVPGGKVQALLDTGDPTAIVPVALMDAIYSKVPGAIQYTDGTAHIWILPCNTTTNVELVFGGVRYPIHPLDLSTFSDPISINGQDMITCVSTINGADNWSTDFDISLGDTFLRNVYSVFDFGDSNPDGSTGEPYVRLLAQTDPLKAKQQVITIRSATMANMPPEIDPATLIGYLTGSSAAPSTPSSTTPDSPDSIAVAESGGSDSAAVPAPTGDHKAFSADINANGVNIAIDESTLKKYGLIAIALLGLNSIIGIVLIVLGVLGCVRRGSPKKSASGRNAPVYVPVKTHGHDEYGGYQKPYSQ